VVENLVKRYGRKVAVDGVSFTLEPGSVVGLVGPNGAGKSTTIKCILGLVRPNSGRILVDGVPVSRPEARKLLGYVPEVPEAPSWMTPLEFLEVLALLEGFSRTEARRVARSLLEEFGLSGKAGERIGRLSKGMRKRLLIAQALIGEKRYVLMDEPFSGLDPDWVSRARSIVRRLRGDGVGVLLSSHLLRELEDLVDGVVFIYNGRVVYRGDMEGLRELVGGGMVEARVSDARRVAELVESSGLARRVEVEGDVVRIYLRPDADAGDVARLIYSTGVKVYSLEAKSVSLEEAYKVLGGGEG